MPRENPITDHELNLQRTNSLKEKFVAKYETRSVLDRNNDIVNAPVFTPYKDDVVKALKYASKAYMMKTSQQSNGTIIYDGRPYTASNLPIAARYRFYWGLWMFKVLETEVKGKSLKKIITQLPTTPAESYSIFYDIPESYQVSKLAYAPKVFPNLKNLKGTKAGGNLADAFEDWLDLLNEAIDYLQTVYSDLNLASASAISAGVEASEILMDVLRLFKVKRNDERFATYVICILQNYTDVYARLFEDQGVKDPKYSYLPSKVLYLRDHQLDPKAMFEDFKCWLNETLYIEDFEAEKGLLSIDFQKGIKYSLAGGTITLSTDIFDQIVDIAANGTALHSQERIDLNYELDHFERVYEDLAKAYAILTLNKISSAIPQEIGILIPHETFDVDVGHNLEDFAAHKTVIVKECAHILGYFQRFVKEFFYRAEGKRLFPNVSIRTRLHDGLPEIYRMHFFSPKQRVYTMFKIEDYDKANPEKSFIKLVDMFSTGGSRVLSRDDGPGINYLNKKGVTFTLDENYIKNWYDQLLFHRLFRISDTIYRAEYDTYFNTIDANQLGVKPKLILNIGGQVRQSSGYDYTKRAVFIPGSGNTKAWSSMTDTERANFIVDVWFGFACHEVMDPTSFQNLYESRLDILGVPSSMPIITDYTPFIGEKKEDVNWRALAAVVGTRFATLKKNTYYLPLVHAFTDAADIVNANGKAEGIHTLTGKMSRYVKIPVAIPKENLSATLKEHYETLKSSKAKSGTILTQSLDSFWNYETQSEQKYFTLTIDDYKCEDGAIPDSLYGYVMMDGAHDIDWGQLYRIVAPNDKAGAKSFNFCVKAPLASAECVDTDKDDRMVIFEGVSSSDSGRDDALRVVADWNELYASTLQHDDILVTMSNCLRNIFLEVFDQNDETSRSKGLVQDKLAEKATKDLLELYPYVCRYYDETASVLFEGAIEGVVPKTMFDELTVSAQKDLNKYRDYFNKIFGSDPTLKAEKPAFDYFSYERVLRSSENAEILLPRNAGAIKVITPALSRYDFKNLESLNKLIDFYVVRKLSEKLKDVIG